MTRSTVSPLENANRAVGEAYLVAALYKFVSLNDLTKRQTRLQALCEENRVFGTLLLAHEGINGTIAGPEAGVRTLIAALRGEDTLSDLEVKESWAPTQPFLRMKVRLKKEIVTLGVDGVDPVNRTGEYVDPMDWNALINRPDVVVVDTRNDYEVEIGTFHGASDPKTSSFSELPDWVDNQLDVPRDTPIAMFCTGGIRCEKSTALLKAKGFSEVYHLKGGILKYLEEVPAEDSLWEGECFVFDQRVSVTHGLEVGTHDLCHACRMPITEQDKSSALYEEGVSCPKCHGKYDEIRLAAFRERQNQLLLAKTRGTNHLAVDIRAARQRKRREKEEQRKRSAGRETPDRPR
ncbi:MAG: rhodanese-related sulfurtransferase [Pseudomonadota bacterium]